MRVSRRPIAALAVVATFAVTSVATRDAFEEAVVARDDEAQFIAVEISFLLLEGDEGELQSFVERMTFSRLIALASVWRTRRMSSSAVPAMPISCVSTSSNCTKMRALDS